MTEPPISIDMLEEGHILILGTTGAGKTYQLRGLIEQLRRADRRVGAIDKLGNHWGLTLSPDGQRPGLDFVIFGGKRAHVPMTPDQGGQLGRLFVERNVPAIFDVSQWKSDEQQQWVADFADAVFLHNEAALHLAIDEAQSWVPQGGGGDAFRSVQRLAEQGRGNGIRLMLACQRWSRLDASVRGMADNCIVAMRQTSPIDRKAIAELVALSREQNREVQEALPLLKAGEAFLWEPRSAELRRVRFPANTTFDSSRTPRHGDTPPPPIAVSGDLVDELRAALAPEVPDYPDDSIPGDPGEAFAKGGEVGTMLRERDSEIAALRDQLAAARAELNDLRGVDAECDRYQRGFSAIIELAGAVRNGRPHPMITNAPGAFARTGGEATPPATSASEAGPRKTKAKGRGPGSITTGASAKASADAGAPTLNRTALDAAALLRGALTPDDTLIWNDVLLLLGRRPNSGDSRAARKGLVEAGLISNRGDAVEPLPSLFDRADIPFAHWPGPDQLVERWSEKLRGPGGEMLRDIAANGPASSAEVAARLGKSATSGWWRQGLKDLRNSNVARETGGVLELHPYLRTEEK
ncbi:type IV secretion system DNA-binding domain-containing protein [Stakelama tenebrarum]|uniref:Type IV secretion system DNA-binding domain-containing protein n=1 Tax=Stakelama tenebrarum TaxID=2711215 RepID=A0A6G6Y595_9SPHN|nr:type IV secretion system DNA-binding domain-containing protein [Sphingosinithalassobacter tenebrarum]QIG80069.1 type IV secretion system DNA-binding domain-containing protein [Sphingosinithalassobacter tenebrarum]